MFQSYQFRQINPDSCVVTYHAVVNHKVSIVSIQADQSRHVRAYANQDVNKVVSIVSIQADQSRLFITTNAGIKIDRFQSYQFRQINPDSVRGYFPQIGSFAVSIVSIQADQSRLECVDTIKCIMLNKFQSYQFRQINPD